MEILIKSKNLFRRFIILLCLWLLISSISPVFGYHIFLYGPLKVEPFNAEIESTLFLITIKSASFMTMIYFALNYLRKRRPLSSMEPLLVMNNFLIAFGSIFLVQSAGNSWIPWVNIFVHAIISMILFQEHKSESKTIFKNDW